jgi:hypothetical protein
MNHIPRQLRSTPAGCGWNHRRIGLALGIIVILVWVAALILS